MEAINHRMAGAKRFGLRWLDTAFGCGGLTPAQDKSLRVSLRGQEHQCPFAATLLASNNRNTGVKPPQSKAVSSHRTPERFAPSA